MIPANADLHFDRMPPLWVPLRAFLIAPFLGLGGGLLLASAGDAAFSSRWTASLLASAHLITLGFITLVMIGAVIQVLPVVTGVPVPASNWVAPASQFGVALGVIAMAWGLNGGLPVAGRVGAVLLAAGLSLFVPAALIAAWKTRHNPTGRAMGLSILSLIAVAGLGVFLLAGHAGWVPLRRDLTDIHAAWALGGWVGLLVMGVSFQVVPLFQVTPSYPRVVEKYLPAVGFLALLAWTAGRLGRWALVANIGIVSLALSLGTYAAVTLWLQTQRRRKLRDITTDAWRLGMGCLGLVGLATIAATFGVLDLLEPRTSLTFGILLVMGFAVSVVQGMLYKIVPFLSWLHLQNVATHRGVVGQVKVKNMRQLLPVKGPRRQFASHLVAIGALLIAAWFGGFWVRIAGLAVAVDFGLLGIEVVGVVRRYREDEARILSAPQ
ncbi:MAG: hypothetical protein GXP36_00215 [Actinobacteria bacterium]|nr:hypothetical protein [Actinomycetota bacterium]